MLKRCFVSGLLVWIPIVITIVAIRILFELVDGVLSLIPAAYQPQTLLGTHIPGIGLVILLIVVMLTGLLASHYLGRKFVTIWENLFHRIPLVRTIHGGVKQAMQVILSDNGKSFRQALLVQYPRKGLWSIAFLTNTCATSSETANLLAVFVPTTPNPTSGFLLLVKPEETIPLDLSVDQALKLVITLGTVMPTNWESWSTLIDQHST